MINQVHQSLFNDTQHFSQFATQLRQFIKLILALSISSFLLACGSGGDANNQENEGTSELATFFIALGLSLEGVSFGPQAPYSFGPEDKTQRYVAASGEKVTVFNQAGETVSEREISGNNFGALYLVHPNDGDYTLIFGANGKIACPVITENFCQILDLPGNVNTTDVKYLRNADMSRSTSTVVAVKAGNLEQVTPESAGYSQTQIFAGTNLPDAEENLVSFDSLSPNTGIGASEDGIVYYIDTNEAPNLVTRINDNSVGTDIRDVVCTYLQSGSFACGIQSFADQKLSLCIGTNATDFECSETVDVGDGVSIGVAETADGNIAVVSTGFSDGSIHLSEFSPSLDINFNDSVSLSDFSESHFGNTLGMPPQLGHATIDAKNNSFMVTGFDTGDLAYILFDDFSQAFKEIKNTEDTPFFGSWFSF